MGTWFLANACANKLAGSLSALIPPGAGEAAAEGAGPVKYPAIVGYQINNLYDFFMVFIVLSGIAAVVLFLLSNFLKKRMHGIH
jgi:POT family proton-dependent oligopeptide transporter